MIIDRYIAYIRDVRRYSPRTVQIYNDVVRRYATMTFGTDDVSDDQLLEALNSSEIRSYEVRLLDQDGMVPKTVRLHMSALSGFCRFLMKEGLLKKNTPVDTLVHLFMSELYGMMTCWCMSDAKFDPGKWVVRFAKLQLPHLLAPYIKTHASA